MTGTIGSRLAASLAGPIAALAGARQAIIAGLAVAGLCLPLGYCAGTRGAEARCDAARALANLKAGEIDARAKDAAAAARVTDALAVERHEQELIDAISALPDDRPDAVRVALGCQRLRAQGTPEAQLPPVCRS